MQTQKSFRLSLPENSTRSSRETIFQTRRINGKDEIHHVEPQKLFGDLLKRQGLRIMSDVSECPPDTLPAHLSRLDDWRAVVNQAISGSFVEPAETRLSGAQLVSPATLADWLAAAHITRQQHRAPSYCNNRDEMLEKIFRGIDQLAGLISTDPELIEFLSSRENEVQS